MYLPVTWYFILFVAFGWLVFRWLLSQQQIPGSSFSDIFALLLVVAVTCIGIMLAFALLSVLVSFLYFIVKKRRRVIRCTIETAVDTTAAGGRQRQLIRLQIHPVLKPFLGFIRLRLLYDHKHFSEKFSLAETGGRKWNELSGVYHWPLPQIREYHLQQVIVYFEDLFQFFSFPVTLDTQDRFYTRPDKTQLKNFSVRPRKTEETKNHIDEMKKVEGEHVNYKHFESNDDVRRIVWKIYARNKELVVRTPEVMDPYASHLTLYASFHSIFDVRGNPVAEQLLLDYYKTIVHNTYEQLVKQGFEVQYTPDQPVAGGHYDDEAQAAAYQVSVAQWQHNRSLIDYVKPADAGMIIVSSFTNAEELEELLGRYGNQVSFMLVKLGKAVRQQHAGDWLQWLFVAHEENSYDKYKAGWQLSALRGRMLSNEKKLVQLLSSYEKTVVI